MALELFTNDAVTTVASGGTDAPAGGTGESWTVTSSASFPAASNSASPPTQFHVADPAAPSEVIAVTNVASTTWTVTRGAESTTPVTHTAGFTVVQVVTAGDYTAMFPLIPTAVQSGTVTASPGQMVLISTAGSAGTINFPHAPSGVAAIGAKLVTYGSANTVTVNATGGDTFSGGGSTATLTVLGEGGIWQYDTALAEWVKQSNDLPLSQMDSRYFAQSQSWTEVNNTGEILWSIQPSGGTDTVSPFNMSIGAATFGSVVGPQLQFGYNVSPGTPGGTQNANGSMYLNFFGDAGDTNSSGAHGVEANIAFRTPGSTAQTLAFQAIGVNDTTNTLNLKLQCGTGSSGAINSGLFLGNSNQTMLSWNVSTNTIISQAVIWQIQGTGAASSGTQFQVNASGTNSNAILSVNSVSGAASLTINGASGAGTAILNFEHAGTANWIFYTDGTNLDLRLYDQINGAIALDVFAGATNLARKLAVNATLQVNGGSAVIGSGTLATIATDGFLYIPSCGGAPTGVPTTKTGTVPIVYDTTDSKLYIYRSSAWAGISI